VTRRQRVLDERMLAYVAITRASSRLLITGAAAGEDGKPLRPSSYLGDLRRALPDLAEQRVEEPAQAGSTWRLWTPQDLAAALTFEMGQRVAGTPAPVARRTLWNDLYTLRWMRPTCARRFSRRWLRWFSPTRPGFPPRPSTPSRGRRIPRACRSWRATPLARSSGFAQFGLRLRVRREADLKATDVGTVHHAILEAYLNDCLAQNERFADIAMPTSCPGWSVRRESLPGNGARRRYSQRSRRVPAAAQRPRPERGGAESAAGGRRGRFVPRAAERRYGFDDADSMAALAIVTPKGRQVFVRGVIDRIDLAEVGEQLVGVVVDYKRTRDKRLDLSWVYHGLSLQLLGYLLALAERGEKLRGGDHPGGRVLREPPAEVPGGGRAG